MSSSEKSLRLFTAVVWIEYDSLYSYIANRKTKEKKGKTKRGRKQQSSQRTLHSQESRDEKLERSTLAKY